MSMELPVVVGTLGILMDFDGQIKLGHLLFTDRVCRKG